MRRVSWPLLLAAVLLLIWGAVDFYHYAVIGQEISSEGLWNEYSYVIVNGSTWYDIEVSGYGHVTELESGTGTYRD